MPPLRPHNIFSIYLSYINLLLLLLLSLFCNSYIIYTYFYVEILSSLCFSCWCYNFLNFIYFFLLRKTKTILSFFLQFIFVCFFFLIFFLLNIVVFRTYNIIIFILKPKYRAIWIKCSKIQIYQHYIVKMTQKVSIL